MPGAGVLWSDRGSIACGPGSVRRMEVPNHRDLSVAIRFNHMIVPATEKRRSATFLTDILGLPQPVSAGFFEAVALEDGVTVDFADAPSPVPTLHLAFLISEDDFDGVLGRIRERGITYWPDPRRSAENVFNTNDGGRGMYFADPDGHFLEVITRPYGG